ncbi:hypothetical protein COO60DRAFT_1629551 [Scenedesmus sp. NREL 46B-D3]|nr:hypothetical protein COO60DRAFT_1629551 [Scenedesmus sp. NREL 46B-D3]
MSNNGRDAEQGIPAVDPAAAAEGQYASMGQGAGTGAGAGAALGGAVGAAGGPVGSVLGAAAGGLAGAVAGGTVATQRGPEGAAIDMSKLPANAAGEPNSVPDTKTGTGTPAMAPDSGAPGPDVGKATAAVSNVMRGQ